MFVCGISCCKWNCKANTMAWQSIVFAKYAPGEHSKETSYHSHLIPQQMKTPLTEASPQTSTTHFISETLPPIKKSKNSKSFLTTHHHFYTSTTRNFLSRRATKVPSSPTISLSTSQTSRKSPLKNRSYGRKTAWEAPSISFILQRRATFSCDMQQHQNLPPAVR